MRRSIPGKKVWGVVLIIGILSGLGLMAYFHSIFHLISNFSADDAK